MNKSDTILKELKIENSYNKENIDKINLRIDNRD